MPRQPRLDAPGTWQPVMGRGIERTQLCRSEADRRDFGPRMATLCRDHPWAGAAWALLPNHFHRVVRTGRTPRGQSMQRLLTGYGGTCNRRHNRGGHLLQNRYKSSICEEDPYLLELTRDSHLKPVRRGLVPGLRALRRYPWTGQSALLGVVERAWQDTPSVLAAFG